MPVSVAGGTWNGSGGAAFLDNNAVRNLMSSYNIENLVQSIIAIEGFGCTSEYTTDFNAKSVDIPSLLMPEIGATRELGSSVNGGPYNANNTSSGIVDLADDIYTVNLTYVWDRTKSVSRIKSDLAGKRQLEEWTQRNITKAMATEFNVSTLAKQLYAGLILACMFAKDGTTLSTTEQAAAIARQVFVYDQTKIGPMNTDQTSPLSTFIRANTVLSSGDPNYFLGYVEAAKRQAFLRESYVAMLKITNAITNADIGLMQQFTGYVNPFNQSEAQRVNNETGVFGGYDGAICSFVAEYIWTGVYKSVAKSGAISNWFAIDPAGTGMAAVIATLDKVQGVLAASAGTYRGIAVRDEVAIENDPHNPLTRRFVQGFARWGVETLVPTSVKIIANAAITATEIGAIRTAVPSVKAPAIAG